MKLEKRRQVEVKSRAELRKWLAANCEQDEAVWLVSYKKVSPHYLPYEAIVEEALCFGWIDSTARKLDAERSMLLLTPRRTGSAWSRPNKQRAERLLNQDLMTAPGLAKVEQAKRDGSWEFLDDVENLAVPDDLAQALKNEPPARANFEQFPRSAKRSILEWTKTAKRPETRARRVAETARLAAVNVRANTPEAKGR